MSVETSTHNKSHFGNAATLAVDGLVETQPLHLPKINVNSQQQHNNDDTFITGRIASAASSKSPATMLRQQRRSDENHHSSSHKQEPHNLKKNHEMNRSFTSSSLSYRIPNGVRAVYTPDVNKVSMPIFGSQYFIRKLKLVKDETSKTSRYKYVYMCSSVSKKKCHFSKPFPMTTTSQSSIRQKHCNNIIYIYYACFDQHSSLGSWKQVDLN